MSQSTYLCLSDLQLPWENEKALAFCLYLKNHFKIPKENIYCVGDEVDGLHGSAYPKDPDATHTPNQELKEAREKIQEWAAVFPQMKIAISNHGLRWMKKASGAEIPSQLMRSYKEIIGAPDGWQWKYSWTENCKHPFLVKHGLDLSGKTPYRKSAELSPISTIFGHLHSSAGIAYVKTNEKNIWSMNVGCLIDPESFAFKYERDHTFKPCLGAGVVFDGGRIPMWYPL